MAQKPDIMEPRHHQGIDLRGSFTLAVLDRFFLFANRWRVNGWISIGPQCDCADGNAQGSCQP
jgi:hypothetical protein